MLSTDDHQKERATAPCGPGILFLVVGPSGAGKDTLIAEIHRTLRNNSGFVFPQRTITRAADAGGENHHAVSEQAFAAAEEAGAFALSWRAHTLAYGIPADILQDLAEGQHVIVNASRSIVAQAIARFPFVRVLHVTAPESVLRERLAYRNRESASQQGARAARAAAITESADVVMIINDGSVVAGGQRLLAAVQEAVNAAR
jgi:phosphonate metabolism protein PhnN/1,5-bisphosphokinase (PRPP-forming)